MRQFLILFILYVPVFLFSQAYPYEYYPTKGSSKGKMCGLVSAENIKITEPLYEIIEPFLNPSYNDYTIYHRSIPNPPGSKYPHHSVSGLIHKSGKPVENFEGQRLSYDGNGRLAFIHTDTTAFMMNLRSRKIIHLPDSFSVRQKFQGPTYYVQLFNTYSKIYMVLDENGKAWAVDAKRNQSYEYVKMIDEKPVFELKNYKTFQSEYFNAEGVKIAEKEVHKSEAVEDYSGIDESVPEPTSSSVYFTDRILDLETISSLQSKFPEHAIGNTYRNIYGQVTLVQISMNNKHGLIDPEGNIILETNYSAITPLQSDFNGDGMDDRRFIEYKLYSNSGLISTDGKILLQPKFGFLQFNNKYNLIYMMGPNGYAGYMNEEGRLFLPKECGCIE